MIRAASTYVFIKERLNSRLLDQLQRGGAETIEIFAARSHFDYANRRSHVLEVADWFNSAGIPLHSMHAPMYSDYEWGRSGAPPVNIASGEKKARIEAMDEIKRAIEIAEVIPFRFLVQHVGTSGESFSEAKVDAAITCLEHLRAFAKPLGVRLLLENIPNELSEPDKLVKLIEMAHFDDVGICFDVGHAHIMSNVADAFHTLKHLVRSTHLHDNGKQRDEHLWPGDGSVDWKETLELLRGAPHVPPLLLEIEGEGKTDIPGGMAKAFARLEKGSVT